MHTADVRWDRRKAAANYKKHGVLFADAATVLDDPEGLTIEDRRFAEQRLRTVGVDALGKVLVVVYAYPVAADVIRLISARQATPGEKRQILWQEKLTAGPREARRSGKPAPTTSVLAGAERFFLMKARPASPCGSTPIFWIGSELALNAKAAATRRQ